MAETRISRRDFLKLLASGIAGIYFGGLNSLGALLSMINGPFPLLNRRQSSYYALAQSSWSRGPDITTVAIHAALLHNGKIFYLAGSRSLHDHQNGPFESKIFDPNTGSEVNISLPEDLFSTGITHLPNGDLLLAGGTQKYDTDPKNCNGRWHGRNSSYIFETESASIVKVSSMAHGRSYPTCITLANGYVAVINGVDEFGSPNRLIEVYDPNSRLWSIKFDPNTSFTYCVGNGSESSCIGAGLSCYGGLSNGVSFDMGINPRMHLMPDGKVIICGMGVNIRSWDPQTGIWRLLTQSTTPRYYGTSFLLPLENTFSERGKILLAGGSPSVDGYATTNVEILDFNQGSTANPLLRQALPIAYRRNMQSPIILPNGKLVIFGGSEQGNSFPVYIPEMFDPVSETWMNLPPASVPRLNNHVSLLLPDGRVWTAGGITERNEWEQRTEIFSPEYMSEERPSISGTPSVGNYGDIITIPTPDAASITSVSLVRLMSTTQYYEANQRLIWLQITSGDGDEDMVTVSAPINANIAPPGMYMIHILNSSGVPSEANIIKIPG